MKKILFLILFSLTCFAQRNVVLIIADDLGKDYCDFYTDHLTNTVKLTNVKRLFDRGVIFNNAWSNPLCSPTRAGVLTGRYSFRTGVGDVVDGSNPKLSLNEYIIPKVLNLYNPNGISKACIGKWHVTGFGAAAYDYPRTMGFDHFEGSLLGALGPPGQLSTGYYNWTKITNNVSSTCTTYATTENVNNAISYIGSQPATKPFFLWLAFNAPHTPYQLPPASLLTNNTLSGTQADITANPVSYYQAMVEAMDKEIGRLFDYLESSGKWANTDIIFMGDNGDDALVEQTANSKGTVYQGGVSVPFIISGPDVVSPNRTSNAVVNTADLFATILEMFGCNNWQTLLPSTTTTDSKSLMPIVLNQTADVRNWSFTEVFRTTPTVSDGKAIRNQNYKLIKLANGTEKFYKLSTDPLETTNILPAAMTSTDASNYAYLCTEMSNLVGTGITCSTLDSSIFGTNNEIFVVENPFQSKIKLNTNTKNDNFILYSITGRMLYEGKNIEDKDFSYLANGTYILKNVTRNISYKLVKH